MLGLYSASVTTPVIRVTTAPYTTDGAAECSRHRRRLDLNPFRYKEPGPVHDRTHPLRDYLAWAALAATLVVTASAKYDLARAAGFDEWTAAALPAGLDLYAVRALRARRDVATAVAAMIAANAAAHLVAAGLLPVAWPLIVGVSAIAPLVLWRVHRLAEHCEDAVQAPAERHLGHAAPATATLTEQQAAHRLGVATAPAAEVAAKPAVEQAPVSTAPATAPLVICGDRKVFALEVPPGDSEGEVPNKQRERLSTDAARVVLEACWAKGTSPAAAARLATRSTSYAKKVFARLDDDRGPAPVPGQLALVGDEVSV